MDISDATPKYHHHISAGFLALLLIFLSVVARKWFGHAPKKLISAPTAEGGWPVFGHLWLLGGTELPHKTLGALADKYGPIFSIRLGSHPVLVVSSSEVAKECFTTHDRAFSSRPKLVASKYLGYDFAMFGLAPHGPYWREMRKISTYELLSHRQLELLKHVRVSEVEASIRDLHALWSEKRDAASGHVLVDMKARLEDLSLNMIARMVAGKRYGGGEEEARRWKKAMRDFFRLLGLSVVSDAFPFLEWLDIGGHIKTMKRTSRELDAILEGWLEEHRQRKVSASSSSSKCDDDDIDTGEKTFMDVMLAVLKGKDDFFGYHVDTVVKATLLTIMSGGTDTSTVGMTWAISLLLNNPHALKKVQEELTSQIGHERMVEESDLRKLVYLQAIIKETWRLYPPAPFLPRECIEDCTIAGNYVPKGTRLIVNLWKIQTDPRTWSVPDPMLFRPERFLEDRHKDADVRGQHFGLIPFGCGRRICPGLSFGHRMVHLALANVLHAFEISNPSSAPVDMTESVGLTNMKATPLEILIKPRLPSQVYTSIAHVTCE